jgi:hypothetical protein
MLRGDVWGADNYANIQPAIVTFASNHGRSQWTGPTFINLEGRNPRGHMQLAGATIMVGMVSNIGIEIALRVVLTLQKRAGNRRGRRPPRAVLREKEKELH